MIYIIMFMIVITKDGVINVSTSSKLPQRRVYSMSLCTTHNRCV